MSLSKDAAFRRRFTAKLLWVASDEPLLCSKQLGFECVLCIREISFLISWVREIGNRVQSCHRIITMRAVFVGKMRERIIPTCHLIAAILMHEIFRCTKLAENGQDFIL